MKSIHKLMKTKFHKAATPSDCLKSANSKCLNGAKTKADKISDLSKRLEYLKNLLS